MYFIDISEGNVKVRAKRILFFFISVPVLFAPSCKSNPGRGAGASAPGSKYSVGQSPPGWINSPYSKYNKEKYVAVTGSGKNSEEAKKSALANLVKYFGQTIQADQKISTTYSEVVKRGAAANWTESTVLEENISTYATNTLIGADVPEIWSDGRNVCYAVAVMDKAKTEKIYTDLIRANQAMIGNLININQKEKNTIEGFSRYRFAAVTADINITFANVLKVIGSPVPSGIKSSDEYWLEAANIAKFIPVRVAVEKKTDIDRAGSIQNAFSRALSELGFITTSDNALYTLEVTLSLTEANYPNRQSEFIRTEVDAKFARYEVSANLTDANTKMGLLPIYSINGEAVQSTLQEAENRAVIAAERKINEQFRDWLSEQLAQRLSKR